MKKALFVLFFVLITAGYALAQDFHSAFHNSQGVCQEQSLADRYRDKAGVLWSKSSNDKEFRIDAPEVKNDDLEKIRGGAFEDPGTNIQQPVCCDIILWDENRPKTTLITHAANCKSMTIITFNGR